MSKQQRKKKHFPTPAEVDNCKADYKAGKTKPQLMAYYNISRTTLNRVLNGTHIHDRGKEVTPLYKPRTYTSPSQQKIKELLAEIAELQAKLAAPRPITVADVITALQALKDETQAHKNEALNLREELAAMTEKYNKAVIDLEENRKKLATPITN